MFPSFTIFGRTIGMYGVLAVAGLLVCGVVCYFATRKQFAIEDITLLFLCASAGIVVGGHALYGLLNFNVLVQMFRAISHLSFKDVFSILGYVFGGSVFYGGFLGSIAGVYLYGKITKKKGVCLDMLAFSTPLFHCFGRIGCFLGGCCYGIESKFGFTAHNNTLSPAVNDVSRFPVQLVEAVLNLVIFAILITFFKKEKFKNELIIIYMLMYAPVRFGLEFLRGDEIRGIFFGISTSQWISMALFLFATVYLLIKKFRKKTPVLQNENNTEAL